MTAPEEIYKDLLAQQQELQAAAESYLPDAVSLTQRAQDLLIAVKDSAEIAGKLLEAFAQETFRN